MGNDMTTGNNVAEQPCFIWTSALSRACMAVLLVLAAGCDNCRRSIPEEPGMVKSHPDAGEAASDETQPATVTASMRVVNLANEPLPGMLPIATLQPNAFDEPIATGTPTNIRGESRIHFPADRKVALRAWDPDLRFFPNNFFEVLPHTGTVTDTLLVSMVEAARIEATLFLPDGRPAINENAGLMLFHSVHGPWWPAEADAGEQGEIVFPRIPPGQFVLRLKVASGPSIEIPETYIAPGETTHLGLVYLQ